MGQSTDAYLYFGFDFYDAESGLGSAPEWGDDRDWASWAYAEKLPQETKDKLKELNIEIDCHCSGDYPVYFICTKESFTRAWRGYPKEAKMDAGENAIGRIGHACELLGIEFQEPKWWLASYWG